MGGTYARAGGLTIGRVVLMPHGCGEPLSPGPSCSGLAAPGPPGSRWGRPLPGGQAGYQAEMGSLPHSHKKGCKKLAAAHATCRAWLAPHSRNNLSQGCPDWRHKSQALRVPACSSGAGTGAPAPLLAQPGPSSSQNRDRQCPTAAHGADRDTGGAARGRSSWWGAGSAAEPESPRRVTRTLRQVQEGRKNEAWRGAGRAPPGGVWTEGRGSVRCNRQGARQVDRKGQQRGGLGRGGTV